MTWICNDLTRKIVEQLILVATKFTLMSLMTKLDLANNQWCIENQGPSRIGIQWIWKLLWVFTFMVPFRTWNRLWFFGYIKIITYFYLLKILSKNNRFFFLITFCLRICCLLPSQFFRHLAGKFKLQNKNKNMSIWAESYRQACQQTRKVSRPGLNRF